VTLLEAREQIGGALALWAKLPGRENYRPPIDWWDAELKRLGVDVRLSIQADAAMVLAAMPDAVIVATGGRYSPGGRSIHRDADIPGYNRPVVFRPEDILLRGERLGGKVILLDGEGMHASAGIAEMLASEGADVSYISAGFSPLSPRITDSFEGGHIVTRLKNAGVRFVPTTWMKSIGENSVVLYDTHTGEERNDAFDAVVLATGREPLDALSRDLQGRVAQLFTIGDALAARPLASATYEGQKFARLIGEQDAPATLCETFFQRDDPATTILSADTPR
jgi:pyruvate/2-oxoglutarate dehydrogenase complex dihydrolipoamide dehydrogenase (E3) component